MNGSCEDSITKPDTPVQTPEACVAFVNRVKLCVWREQARFPFLPSLEAVTPWRGFDLTMQTWFWKDDLHNTRQLYFGMLLKGDVPLFASLEMLPFLIAAQGDNDARMLYEQGQLSHAALRVYEHVERNGPTATNALPWPARTSRMANLAVLQRHFLLTKHDLTGRTRGTYGYRWDVCENAFPEAFRAAAAITVEAAREKIVAHLQTSEATVTPGEVAHALRWI